MPSADWACLMRSLNASSITVASAADCPSSAFLRRPGTVGTNCGASERGRQVAMNGQFDRVIQHTAEARLLPSWLRASCNGGWLAGGTAQGNLQRHNRRGQRLDNAKWALVGLDSLHAFSPMRSVAASPTPARSVHAPAHAHTLRGPPRPGPEPRPDGPGSEPPLSAILYAAVEPAGCPSWRTPRAAAAPMACPPAQ